MQRSIEEIRKELRTWKVGRTLSRVITVIASGFFAEVIRAAGTADPEIELAALIGSISLVMIALDLVLYCDKQMRRCRHEIRETIKEEEMRREMLIAECSGNILAIAAQR